MPQTESMNPVFADLNDLLSLKQRAVIPLGQTRKQSYSGVGEMKSPFKTKGLDFQEVRAYQAGDDVRLIDWRVTAKYGKPFTKLYTDEKERQIYFICDMRSGMKFATQGAFKSVLVARGSAFLTFMAQQRGDKIGYTIINADKIETARCTTNHQDVLSFLKKLEFASVPDKCPPDTVSLADALHMSDKQIKSGSIVFILSDFADWDDRCETFIGRWHQKSTCAFLHVYDTTEESLPSDLLPVSNGQDVICLDMQNQAVQRAYEQVFARRRQRLEKIVQTYQLGFVPIRTDSPAIDLIETYCLGNKP